MIKFRVGDVIVYTFEGIERGTVVSIDQDKLIWVLREHTQTHIAATERWFRRANARLDDSFEQFVREVRQEEGLE